MYKRDHKVRAGNDRFEGFAVDLIAEVAKMLNFDYDIYLVHDGKFGSKMADGNWNGMIGELLAGVGQLRQSVFRLVVLQRACAAVQWPRSAIFGLKILLVPFIM